MTPQPRMYTKWQMLLFWGVCLCLFGNCANPGMPTGGPKDEVAPQLLATQPEDGELNYTSRKVELLFDEKVDVRDVQKELIISPNLPIEYTVKAQKNAVVLLFKEDLPDSTTFALDFRDSIKDATEKNPSAPVKVAFSTGPYMDTLGIRGTVRNYLTGQPLLQASVLLYTQADTFKIETDEPVYFTKTDSAGMFLLGNIRKDRYQLYALLDQDKSLTYNKADESVGFLPRTLAVVDTSLYADVGVLRYDTRECKLVRASSRRQYVDLLFSKELLPDYQIEWENPALADEVLHSFSDSKTLTFYNLSATTEDSLSLTFTVRDSSRTELRESVRIKFNPTDSPATPNKLETRIFPQETELKADSTYLLALQFNKPMVHYVPDSILLVVDKDTVQIFDEIRINHNRTRFELAEVKGGKKATLQLKKGAFLSIENDSSQSLKLDFNVKNPEKHGIVRAGIKNVPDAFFVQLLDEKFNVEQTVFNRDSVDFYYVSPGKKYLRVILDTNANGFWDRGDFSKRTPPEVIHFLKGSFEVKENWEFDGLQIVIPKQDEE